MDGKNKNGRKSMRTVKVCYECMQCDIERLRLGCVEMTVHKSSILDDVLIIQLVYGTSAQ